jgi:hypothetical protein
MTTRLLTIALSLTTISCGGGTGTPDSGVDPRPACTEIVERCHPLDLGTGDIHECHEFAEAEATTDAQCEAMQASCFATCTASDSGTAPVDSGTTPVDSGTTPVDSGTTPTDAGCTGVTVTVLNSLVWCSVSVNGGAPSSGASQTVCVPADSDVSLVATPLSGFELGLWHHTDGDTGTGDMGVVSGGMSTASLTAPGTGTACVWVCCPFEGGAGCPTIDQCP